MVVHLPLNFPLTPRLSLCDSPLPPYTAPGPTSSPTLDHKPQPRQPPKPSPRLTPLLLAVAFVTLIYTIARITQSYVHVFEQLVQTTAALDQAGARAEHLAQRVAWLEGRLEAVDVDVHGGEFDNPA